MYIENEKYRVSVRGGKAYWHNKDKNEYGAIPYNGKGGILKKLSEEEPEILKNSDYVDIIKRTINDDNKIEREEGYRISLIKSINAAQDLCSKIKDDEIKTMLSILLESIYVYSR